MKINIANFILTRKCNLHCDYCRMSGDIDYIVKPREYPDGKDYFKNEKDVSFWISISDKLYEQNKDVFIILYGGEPLLYPDLDKLVKHLNDKGIAYTIISNCTEEVQPKIIKLFEKVGKLTGFTASVDPGFWLEKDDDEAKKSRAGVDFLQKVVELGISDDPVAEITVDNNNIQYLEETVKKLDEMGICSDVTVLCPARTNYYDFSSITDESNLVKPDIKTKEIFFGLVESDYNIHMKQTLLPKIFEILPAELFCEMPKNLDNITIDADGNLRLCLRIRGRGVPNYSAEEFFSEDSKLKDEIFENYRLDYSTLCNGCSWTCKLMSTLEIKDVLNH